jgi:hypothetical protein
MIVRIVLCIFLFALGILAQGGGTITGKVVDLSGDPVANAEIRATNAETKTVYKATTSAAGVYTLAAAGWDLPTFEHHAWILSVRAARRRRSGGPGLGIESAVGGYSAQYTGRRP